MFVRQECDICSGMCCNLLSFTIDIVIHGRPVDMHVILNFLKNEGNLHCLGTTLLRIPTCTLRHRLKMGFKSETKPSLFTFEQSVPLDVVPCNFVDSLIQPPKVYEVVVVGMNRSTNG